jgi:hypothetical protein
MFILGSVEYTEVVYGNIKPVKEYADQAEPHAHST